MAKSATDLTTARFKMLMNTEPCFQNYQCNIENNDTPEYYSAAEFIAKIYNMTNTTVSDETIQRIVKARYKCRQTYFRENYMIHLDNNLTVNKELVNIEIYDVKNQAIALKSIKSVAYWFPVILNENVCIKEFQTFQSMLILQSLEILEEYYTVIDNFPHFLVLDAIKHLKHKSKSMALFGIKIMKEFKVRCLNCGYGCLDTKRLEHHVNLNKCNNIYDHRCVCNKLFKSHQLWLEHWLNSEMKCPIISWSIWRNLNSSETVLDSTNNITKLEYFYKCDGCVVIYSNFLRYWNHIVHCPFYRLFILINCINCGESNLIDQQYFNGSFQKFISKPHRDKVGIKIIRDWAEMNDLNFHINIDSVGLFHETFKD